MSITGTLQYTMRIGTASITGALTKSDEGAVQQDVEIPAAAEGTLTTRTDDDTGVCTVDAGHGITDADYVDVYWAGGVRYGMDVTATTATTISVDGGSGDVLPAVDAAVFVGKRYNLDCDFDGDQLAMIGMKIATTTRGHAEFTTNADANIWEKELVEGELWNWVSGLGATNELAGNDVGKIKVSNGTDTAGTFQLAALFNSIL